jgi:PAS domain-containing protein
MKALVCGPHPEHFLKAADAGLPSMDARYDPRMPAAPNAPTAAAPPALPLDAEGILALAARSMFHLFSSISQGMFLVDSSGRIVWVNEGYRRFLPALGFSSIDQFLGHMVEDVIPNTQMRPRARNRRADPDRPADQQGRHLRRQPHPAARRARGRGG